MSEAVDENPHEITAVPFINSGPVETKDLADFWYFVYTVAKEGQTRYNGMTRPIVKLTVFAIDFGGFKTF